MNHRPNVLLLVVDCLRADRSVEPGHSANTPTLDRLAERGAAFTHMITVNSYTVPCVASLVTGLYPLHHGVRGMATRRISRETPTLAEAFRENGYSTHAEMCGPLSATLGFDRGYDQFHTRAAIRDYLDTSWGAALRARLRSGELREPWFLHVHLWELHQPRRVPREFDSPRYGERAYDRALSSLDHQLGLLLESIPRNTWVFVTGDHGERLTQSKGDAVLQQYKVPVQRFFKRLGIKRNVQRRITSARQHVLRFLSRRGLIKDPLATLVGHGFHVYDYLVRVPFIVMAPDGMTSPARVTQQARQVDIVPTLREAFGLNGGRPAESDGRSLMPLLRGDTLEPAPAFIETTGIGLSKDRSATTIHGVRTDGWKFAYGAYDPTLPEELYDLASDPDERFNLAPALPERLAAMRALADGFFKGATTPPADASTELEPAEVSELKARLRDLGYME